MVEVNSIINELGTRAFKEDEITDVTKGWAYSNIVEFKNILKSLSGDKVNDFMKLMNGIDFLSYVAFNVSKCSEFGQEKGISWKAIKTEIENEWIDGQNGLILDLYNLCPIIIPSEETFLYSIVEKDDWSEEDFAKLNSQQYSKYLITDDPKKLTEWYTLYKYPIRRK